MQKSLPWILCAVVLAGAAYFVLSTPTTQPASSLNNPNGGESNTVASGYSDIVEGITRLISGGVQIAQNAPKQS